MRSVYSVGDTLSIEDQNMVYDICFSDGTTEESFKFADNNGDFNGGDYKITLISMNATW